MGRKFPLLSLIVTATLAAGAAQGKECHAVTFPEQTQSDGSALVLNGLGMRKATLFKVNVYVAALYVAKPTADPSVLLGTAAPYQLILHFVRGVDASDINKGWVEGFARNGQTQTPGLQERIAMLTKWMTDIKSGQRLQFSFKPGAGLQVNVNGAMKGTISGDDFGRAFLSIWLGVPPNPEVKTGMLGGACS